MACRTHRCVGSSLPTCEFRHAHGPRRGADPYIAPFTNTTTTAPVLSPVVPLRKLSQVQVRSSRSKRSRKRLGPWRPPSESGPFISFRDRSMTVWCTNTQIHKYVEQRSLGVKKMTSPRSSASASAGADYRTSLIGLDWDVGSVLLPVSEGKG